MLENHCCRGSISIAALNEDLGKSVFLSYSTVLLNENISKSARQIKVSPTKSYQ